MTSFEDLEAPYSEDWLKSRDYVSGQIERSLPEEVILKAHHNFEKMSDLEVAEIYSVGSGWGALEKMRRNFAWKRKSPKDLNFCFILWS